MEYLAAAYAAIWLVLFIFVLSIFRRQSRIDTELEALEDALERLQEKAS
jgi:CcmD family protein